MTEELWFGLLQSEICLCCATLQRTLPSVYWLPAYVSPVVKRRGREAEHVPPSSDEVKNEWDYTSSPPFVFLVC
jgi:hypothetical protein